MNIGILAVDSNFPNLALMKISAYHKARGDQVEWYTNPFKKLFLKGRCTLLACHPDERPAGRNAGSGIAGHEFHIGHQYRQRGIILVT